MWIRDTGLHLYSHKCNCSPERYHLDVSINKDQFYFFAIASDIIVDIVLICEWIYVQGMRHSQLDVRSVGNGALVQLGLLVVP